MAWQTPKTDWETNPKSPRSADMNRIEGNIEFLQQDIETKKGLIVDELNEARVSASTADTFATLASKVDYLGKREQIKSMQILNLNGQDEGVHNLQHSIDPKYSVVHQVIGYGIDDVELTSTTISFTYHRYEDFDVYSARANIILVIIEFNPETVKQVIEGQLGGGEDQREYWSTDYFDTPIDVDKIIISTPNELDWGNITAPLYKITAITETYISGGWDTIGGYFSSPTTRWLPYKIIEFY